MCQTGTIFGLGWGYHASLEPTALGWEVKGYQEKVLCLLMPRRLAHSKDTKMPRSPLQSAQALRSGIAVTITPILFYRTLHYLPCFCPD